jgi:4-amino-4-deoxy-L-arabinose transferase-like glycosyltransferase
LLLILTIASVLDGVVAKKMSQTMDEGDHISYGVKILQRQPDRSGLYFDSKTPITALNALPRVIAEHIENFPIIRRTLWSLVRLSSVLAALIVIIFIYRFAYDLYGEFAALIAAVLAALSPNLIAHGTVATSDGYFAAGVLAAVYYLRRYLLEPTSRNAFYSAMALALAQLAKPMAIYLYLIAGMFVIIAMIRPGAARPRAKGVAIYAAMVIGLSIAVLNIAYSFDRSFTPWGSYQFESDKLRPLQNAKWIEKIPIPTPYPVLQGLDKMLHVDETGSTWGNVYLLGELRRPGTPGFRNFKSYFLVAWFFKEPIPLQILFVWGVVLIVRHRSRDFLFSEGLILATAAVLVLWLSLFSKAQVGIRHILPALAIEVIIAAAAFSHFSAASRLKKVVLLGLVVWLGVSTFSYYPNLIPYMNEWVTDRRLSYKIVADSNLDWGQDMGTVLDFLKHNPDVVLDPDQPVSGRILVGADRLVGVSPKDKGPLTWALRYEPAAQVGYAHFLFNIPADAVVEQK